MFRLHIDIPVSAETIEKAQEIARQIVGSVPFPTAEVKEMNYRLGNDEDRQRSNYLDMDENGHCSHRKCRVRWEEADGE
jgi:hypothetical protein